MMPELHVTPPSDYVDHEESSTCPCEPEQRVAVRDGKHWIVYLHSAVADPEIAWAGVLDGT